MPFLGVPRQSLQRRWKESDKHLLALLLFAPLFMWGMMDWGGPGSTGAGGHSLDLAPFVTVLFPPADYRAERRAVGASGRGANDLQRP